LFQKLLCCVVYTLICSVAVLAADVLIQNSDFEEGTDSFPAFWEQDLWIKDASTSQYTWSTTGSYAGQRCMRIKNNAPNDARIVQTVTISAQTLYQFSCHIKTENISSEGAGAVLSVIGLTETSEGLHGTHDWEEVVLYLQGGTGPMIIQLSLGIGGYGAISAGTAWFDTVSLSIVPSLPANAKVINLVTPESQTKNENNNLHIEKRPGYWLLTILLLGAALIIFFAILWNIKKNMTSGKVSSKRNQT